VVISSLWKEAVLEGGGLGVNQGRVSKERPLKQFFKCQKASNPQFTHRDLEMSGISGLICLFFFSFVTFTITGWVWLVVMQSLRTDQEGKQDAQSIMGPCREQRGG
jgi:hypothetical protein